ncbi:MAG: acetylornithine/succinylornithine family transaminase, partial [Myxococcota bacterium]
MSRSDPLIATARRVLTQNYRQQPVVMSRGVGCRLYDVDDREFLDMTAGLAVCVLGHAHPALAAAIAAQAGRLLHTSNLYYIEAQIRLAEALVARGFPGRVFFCNSGAEANEAALKLARRHAQVIRGEPERLEIVAFERSFHGRTVGALSVTGQAKYREGFGPLWGPVRFLPFGDLAAARAAIGPRTCAVILEVIQAEGGIHAAPEGFLAGLRDAATQVGALLIVDEVQTGMGRTGRFWAHAFEGARPDVVTIAKGLAGGVPIGAMIASEEVAEAFSPGVHASTFGGNPFACAAALAVLETIDAEGLVARAAETGAHLRDGLDRIARRRAICREVRGRGLLLGLALDREAMPVVER